MRSVFTTKPLINIGVNDLYAVFKEAFRDYEKAWSREEFEKLLQRRGYVAGLSVGAFEKEKLVAFTLNGWGTFNGKSTGYDMGTGTVGAFRGKGLAGRLISEAIPLLKQKGARQYLLEVLQHNTKAVELYVKLGFEISRELNYFVSERPLPESRWKNLPEDIGIEKIDLSRKSEMTDMWDISPSWQNNFAAISRSLADLIVMGAFRNDELIGYGIIEPKSGDIPQLAVRKSERRKGIGTEILKRLAVHGKQQQIKIVNTERTSEAITCFIESVGISMKGYQYEMILDLDQWQPSKS